MWLHLPGQHSESEQYHADQILTDWRGMAVAFCMCSRPVGTLLLHNCVGWVAHCAQMTDDSISAGTRSE